MKPSPSDSARAVITTGIAEVRYSLPEILRELALERANQAFAMEKLDQPEIAKLFGKPRIRRAIKRRQ